MERRQSDRKPLAAQLVPSPDHDQAGITQLVDVSSGGVRIATSRAQKPGQDLTISLQFTATQPVVVLSGKIVWARQIAPYEAGVRFYNELTLN